MLFCLALHFLMSFEAAHDTSALEKAPFFSSAIRVSVGRLFAFIGILRSISSASNANGSMSPAVLLGVLRQIMISSMLYFRASRSRT